MAIDPVSVASALNIADKLGINPLDIAKGAVDWVASTLFGVGQCSDANKARKKAHAQVLDDQTLMDLVNGRIEWSEFSSGDCGKWFQAYAIEELLKRYDAQGGPPVSSQQARPTQTTGSWRRAAGIIVSGVSDAQRAMAASPYAMVSQVSTKGVDALLRPTVELSPGLQLVVDIHNAQKTGATPRAVQLGLQSSRAQEAAAAAAQGSSGVPTALKVAAAVAVVGGLAMALRKRGRRRR